MIIAIDPERCTAGGGQGAIQLGMHLTPSFCRLDLFLLDFAIFLLL